MLQVIVFAIVCGLIGLLYKEEAGPVATFMVSMEKNESTPHPLGNEVCSHWDLCSYNKRNCQCGNGSTSGDLMKYFLVVLLALIVHGSVLMVVAGYAAKKSPFYIVKNYAILP
jgi:Na+/H+-dicarboxylate symporter